MSNVDTYIYNTKGAVLKAKTLGFYKIKGTAAKSGRCRHISCGATKPTSCNYWAELAEHELRLKTGIYYGKMPYDASQQAYATTRLGSLKNYHKACTKDWCEKSIGRPRPSNLGEMVTCTRHHLQPYTEAELAKPDMKPESIAVEMYIALPGSDRGLDIGVGLYDLIDDKWFNDQWWTQVGWKNDNLMPHDKVKEYPAPKDLVNIEQVITALKAAL